MATDNQKATVIPETEVTEPTYDDVRNASVNTRAATDPSTLIQVPTDVQPKRVRKATRKEQAFVQAIVGDHKLTQRDAYRQAYNAERMTDASVDVEASKTLRKPQVQLELAKYSGKAENVLLEVMNYSNEYGREKSGSKEQGAAYAAIAARVADSMLDRIHGKATQRIEAQSTSVVLNIDLTGTA